jgi:2-polyprenyl-3-methyl-5-hydroxy-6-metoxy-1,4-benzoquinol methylase
MTNRDNIYKKHNKWGEAWATLSEWIHELFVKFLDKNNFGTKNVLDIGCGTGKYLEYLKSMNFKTDWIDSSQTAIEMTKKVLNKYSEILCVDMFEFEIPKDKYDLIISISTIHHGTKDKVKKLINKIHYSLKNDGKIFITLPDFEVAKQNKAWENDEKIEEWTYSPTSWPEKWLAHSFYNKNEILNLFWEFINLDIQMDNIGRWIVTGSK